MIEVKNLTKKYGNHLAVNNLSFKIEKGKIYGLLGPNGAGKSTTMNIITGCLAATSGTVTVDGRDIFEEPLEAKKHIGYLPEIPPLYTDMTPLEYLTFVSEAKGVAFDKRLPEIRNVMKLTGLEERADRLIRNLSKGFRQRVGIAQAMIGNPDVIILDEPTVGLDPRQIIEIRELIASLGKIKTVIISSHILAEISAICDHVIIISHGNLVADAPLAELEREATMKNGLSVSVKGTEKRVTEVLSGISGAEFRNVEEKNGTVSFLATPAAGLSGELSDAVFFAFAQAALPIREMVYRESSLESIFLNLTEAGAAAPDYAPAAPSGNAAAAPADAEAPRQTDKKSGEEDDYKPLFGGSNEEDDR